MVRYVGIWQRFLCFCCRVIEDQETYEEGFLDEQSTLIWQLKTLINHGMNSEAVIDEKVSFVI